MGSGAIAFVVATLWFGSTVVKVDFRQSISEVGTSTQAVLAE